MLNYAIDAAIMPLLSIGILGNDKQMKGHVSEVSMWYDVANSPTIWYKIKSREDGLVLNLAADPSLDVKPWSPQTYPHFKGT